MKKILAFILAAVLIFSVGGCSGQAGSGSSAASSKPERVLRYGLGAVSGTAKATGYLGIGIQHKFIDEQLKKVNAKFEVIPFTGLGPAINQALASKSVDIGSMGDVPALIAKAGGIDTTVVTGNLSNTKTCLLVRPDSGITSVSQLKGKKVSCTKGGYVQRTLIQMLKSADLTLTDVKYLNMTDTVGAAALIGKNVDGIVVSDTIAQKLILNKQAVSILDTNGHDDWLNSSETMVLTSYAKENPDVVVAFLKGMIESKEYGDAHPDEMKQLLVDSGYDSAVIDRVYPTKNYGNDLDLSKALYASLTDVNKFTLDNQLTTNSVDINKWLDASYYNTAVKEYKK